MAKKRNLFISHSWAYGDAYEKLVKMLNNAPRFVYANYSVLKNDPVHNAPTKQALYDAIKAKVRFCDVVVIMAGVYSTYSEWISKEIRIAKSDFDKPILAVKPWANRRVSTVVANAADEIAAWNTSSIVSAIRRLDP